MLDVFATSAESVTIIFPDGQEVGAPGPQPDNIDVAFSEAKAFTAFTDGGAEVLVPLLSADVPFEEIDAVVRSFVPEV